MLTIKEDYRVKTLIKFSNKLSPNSLIQYKHRFNLLNQLIKIIVLIWIFKELILTKKKSKERERSMDSKNRIISNLPNKIQETNVNS